MQGIIYTMRKKMYIILALVALLPSTVCAGPWVSGPKYSCVKRTVTVCGSAGKCAKTKQITCKLTGSVRRYNAYWLWWKLGTYIPPFSATRYASVSAYNYRDPPAKLYISSGKRGYLDGDFRLCLRLPFPLPGGRRTICYTYRLGRRFFVKGGMASTLMLMRKWGIHVEGGGVSWFCSLPGVRCEPTSPMNVKAWFSILIFPRSVETGVAAQVAEPGAIAIMLDDGVVLLAVYNPLSVPLFLRGVDVEGAVVEELPEMITVQPNSTDVTVFKVRDVSGDVRITAHLEDGDGGAYDCTLTIELEEYPTWSTLYAVALIATLIIAIGVAIFAWRAAKHAAIDWFEGRKKFIKRRDRG